jgi:hypothetical protein
MTLVARVGVMNRDPYFDERGFAGEIIFHDVKDSHALR